MIFGIGTDICDLTRIQKLLESDKAQAFTERSFTESENNLAPSGKQQTAFYAGRWAAKEAVAKALGTGFGSKCRWLDINITRLESGAPAVELSAVTAETAKAFGISQIHISISHEKSYAVAFATAEK
ncbi:MAG: holo-ACP synthase [Lentisphaeraceae bacterium]|nr:holo-ACP synthase [Lentisphaeraceae bacterium]